jgi:hypothetical protein
MFGLVCFEKNDCRKCQTIFIRNDLTIDYCNYLLQCHFRLANVFKLMSQREKLTDPSRVNDKMLTLLYAILTDSLALKTTFTLAETDTANAERATSGQERKSKWQEMFILSFKELKKHLRGVMSSSSSSALTMATSSVESSSLATSSTTKTTSASYAYEMRSFSFDVKK